MLATNTTVMIDGKQYDYFQRKKLKGNIFEKSDEIMDDYYKLYPKKLDDLAEIWVIRNSLMRAFHRIALAQGWTIKEVEEVISYANNVTSKEAISTGEYDNQLYISYLGTYFEDE